MESLIIIPNSLGLINNCQKETIIDLKENRLELKLSEHFMIII